VIAEIFARLGQPRYIVKVPPEAEACSGGGCGACSMHNLCPSSDASAPSQGEGPELWQLTEKGRSRIVLRTA
jgi:hypothetical protein